MIKLDNKKVLILVNHDIVIYNFRLELVERLLEEGYEVYISSPNGERIDDLIKLGCNYIEANFNRHGLNLLQEWKLLRYYKKIMKQINPAIVLTYTIKPNIYGALAAKTYNIPVISTITGLGSTLENGGIMQKIFINLYKYAFNKVQKVFFQNEENQKLFIDNNIAIDKHILVPGSGVNLSEFSLMEYPSDEIVEFIFISRIMKEKGIDEYLSAAKYITEKYPQTRFHILGFCEEDYEDELIYLEEKGVIQYHGMQRDIRKYLKSTHCTVHPSYHEGMSNVLLESAASGRPIITTDISGCKEIVDEDINGYKVKPQNSKSLIENIERFLILPYNQKKTMGISGRNKVEKEFDRQLVVGAYMDEISNLVLK